jgi:cytochrome d ubiquinol oxidase subunit II
MNLDLPLVFMGLMALAILLYVLLDGFDLGIGMLMPAADRTEQELMVASIGPFWDANETWLVLGIGVLLAAFPLAHGVVLSALYLPVAAMLSGLMLRGVAFEFRIKALGWHRELWNWLFWLGSFLAALAQGWMLGRYVTGFERGFGFSIFSLLCAASLCGTYVLIGAAWLILKSEGALRGKALLWARWGLLWSGLALVLVSIATPLVSPRVFDRWFDFPRTFGLMALPAAALVAWAWVWRSTGRLRAAADAKADWQPLAGAAAIFVIGFLGLAYSLFPYVVIDRLTIWQAAAHPSSLRIVLGGFLVVLPFLVGYTLYAHRVFGGKVREPLYGGDDSSARE